MPPMAKSEALAAWRSSNLSRRHEVTNSLSTNSTARNAAQIVARSIQNGNAHKDLTGLLLKYPSTAKSVFNAEFADFDGEHFPPHSSEKFIFEIIRLRAVAGLSFIGGEIESYLIEAGRHSNIASQAAKDFAEIAENLPLQVNPKNANEVAQGLVRHILESRHQDKRIKLIKLADIFNRPKLKHLLQDILLERGTTVITGDYGAYKSFTVLDWMLCIATGKDWHGRPVKQGPVVYIIAEGAYTTEERVKAWMIRYGYKEVPENFYLIERGVQIADAVQRRELVDEIKSINPSVVVLDTLSKCNAGRDENDTGVMTGFNAAMREIADYLNTQVLAVHHNNKQGTGRGSVSVPADADMSITMKASAGRVVTIHCDRSKIAPFDDISLIGRVVELGEFDEFERPVTSLIFEPTGAPSPMPKADETREKILDILRLTPSGLRASEWQRLVEKEIGCKSSRFYDHRDCLEGEGKIFKKLGVYFASSKNTPITPIHSDFA